MYDINDLVDEIYAVFDNWTDLGAEEDESLELKEEVKQILLKFIK